MYYQNTYEGKYQARYEKQEYGQRNPYGSSYVHYIDKGVVDNIVNNPFSFAEMMDDYCLEKVITGMVEEYLNRPKHRGKEAFYVGHHDADV